MTTIIVAALGFVVLGVIATGSDFSWLLIIPPLFAPFLFILFTDKTYDDVKHDRRYKEHVGILSYKGGKSIHDGIFSGDDEE